MRKQNLIKIIITVVLLIVASVVIVYTDKKNKENATSKEIGSITVELISLDGAKKEKQISFKEGDTVFSLLLENYTVNYENSTYGAKLLGIDDIQTDFTTTYIAIYVDDNYSNVGISYVTIKDGMVLSLRETKIQL